MSADAVKKEKLKTARLFQRTVLCIVISYYRQYPFCMILKELMEKH